MVDCHDAPGVGNEVSSNLMVIEYCKIIARVRAIGTSFPLIYHVACHYIKSTPSPSVLKWQLQRHLFAGLLQGCQQPAAEMPRDARLSHLKKKSYRAIQDAKMADNLRSYCSERT